MKPPATTCNRLVIMLQVTLNSDAAQATVQAANDVAAERAALANFAPVINNENTTLQVRSSVCLDRCINLKLKSVFTSCDGFFLLSSNILPVIIYGSSSI